MNTKIKPARVSAEPYRWVTDYNAGKDIPAIQLSTRDGGHRVVILTDDAERVIHEIEAVAGITRQDSEIQLFGAFELALGLAYKEIRRLQDGYDDLVLRAATELHDEEPQDGEDEEEEEAA